MGISASGAPSRLTSLAHGGGCGCKLSPKVLAELLASTPSLQVFPELLVGLETGDDAAIYRLDESRAIVATTDFFMPIVDDPYDFGRIAAANALSDVYAMGGRPLLALAILGMPLGKIEVEVVRDILEGGRATCAGAGIPVAGGHSIDAPEPIYGLCVIGLIHPDRVRRNSGAQAGDVLVLTKPLGVGVISAALKQGRLAPEEGRELYAALVDSTTRLNVVGEQLATLPEVHAMTDVTGFGLLGHALEMCRGSQAGARIDCARVPLLGGTEALARAGCRTGAAARNWESYAAEVDWPAELPEWRRDLLCDPQTSGGLLIALHPGAVGSVLDLLATEGFASAAAVGEIVAGAPRVAVA